MNESDASKDAQPVVMIVERRVQRPRELSSAEVMRILRKRAAKAGRRKPEDT